MEIKKLGYSSNPWRLVANDGREIYIPELITIPKPGRFGRTDRSQTIVNMPVCGKTKKECTEKALSLLSKLVDLHLNKPND